MKIKIMVQAGKYSKAIKINYVDSIEKMEFSINEFFKAERQCKAFNEGGNVIGCVWKRGNGAFSLYYDPDGKGYKEPPLFRIECECGYCFETDDKDETLCPECIFINRKF